MKQQQTIKPVTLTPAAIEYILKAKPLVTQPVTVGENGASIFLVRA